MIPTPHIEAKEGEFAKTVLMPGDPLRAQFIAENFLENAVLVNDVRGIKGYTGYYKGKRVSAMASGMGQPSIGIYSYELFNFYGVESIIRVGTCGGYDKDLHVRDLIVAMAACTDGKYVEQYGLNGTFSPIADYSLLEKAVALCREKGVRFKVGNILSSDIFYAENDRSADWAKMGVLGVEMESAALYCNALRAGKKALCICTVSDSYVHKEEKTTAKEREKTLIDMIEIALEIAE
ncbi:MAG: purine-nucleoside phosphorylase [Clostridia bacterium]|nr:purine-nucleoside phosphorylase [Clostridia bacterium]